MLNRCKLLSTQRLFEKLISDGLDLREKLNLTEDDRFEATRKRGMRVPLWTKFEEIADEYPELWRALEKHSNVPLMYRAICVFLSRKLQFLFGAKRQVRYTMEEAEAVSGILYGALPRTQSCKCGLKESLNEISRKMKLSTRLKRALVRLW